MRKPGVANPVRTAKVRKIIEENYRVRTIEADCDMPQALPGQFLMVWVPGSGEKPMSIGNSNPLTISVANVGKVSGELHKLKSGDLLSFRGPLGKPFSIPEKAEAHTGDRRGLRGRPDVLPRESRARE